VSRHGDWRERERERERESDRIILAVMGGCYVSAYGRSKLYTCCKSMRGWTDVLVQLPRIFLISKVKI
jgi:hypothetical protein